MRASEQMYVYAWANNPKRATLKGRTCRLLGCMTMNSVVLEFENGQIEVTDRKSIRKVKP